MMWRKSLLAILILCFSLPACVSVSLPTGGGKSSRAQGIERRVPQSPFQVLQADFVDEAWISRETGNIISYLSDCDPRDDRSLESLRSESLAVLTNMKVLEEKNIDSNGRRALWTEAQGEVDGISVRIALVTLKKNGCNYSLSYSGIENAHARELSAFQSFVSSFEAP